MPPEARILGLGFCLPEEQVANEALSEVLGLDPGDILARCGIAIRHRAADGDGPSELARRAADAALAAAGMSVADVGLIVFATATPDVTFPGAACYLQRALGAPTVGALDVRAQSAGFVCGLDLAGQFGAIEAPHGGLDPRYNRVLVAAGEVLTSGLEYAPRGADMTPRFGDGAAVAIVGRGDSGPRIGPVRWYTEGELADRFWCEFPASWRYPLRIAEADFAAGRHYPRADLASLAPIAIDRIAAVAREVLDLRGWRASDLDLLIVDYVEPGVAAQAGKALGIAPDRMRIPTAVFGHVLAAGLPIELARILPSLAPGARVLLAAAGPGFTYGAATLEV
jgi:3-oxoacyl-[acyl-carrier-protein] synthase-3